MAIHPLGLYYWSDHMLHTYLWGVVGGAKDELWGSVVARTNVGDIWLAAYQLLRTAQKHMHILGNRLVN